MSFVCISRTKVAISSILFALFICLFPNPTEAEIKKGYDIYDTNSESLTYTNLENSENLQDFRQCYSEDQLHRYPEIESSARNQAICYDKYSTVQEFHNKLNAINISLDQLDLLTQISQNSLDEIGSLLKNLQTSTDIQNQNLIFFIVPKGAIKKDSLFS